jgi:hypothetical protein
MQPRKSVSSTSTPTPALPRPGEPVYASGKGCATIAIIFGVLLALSIAAIVLFGNRAP